MRSAALMRWGAKVFAAAALISSTALAAGAQEKLAVIGAGAKADSDGTAFSFSFSFNRTEGADVEAGPALWAGRGLGGILALTPSAEANIGSGTESSANNVLLDVMLRYGHEASTPSGFWLAKLGPTVTADKNFRTGLYYLRGGGEYVYTHTPYYPRALVSIGASIDGGHRRSDSLASSDFVRLVPAVAGSVQFRNGFSASAAAKTWTIAGDQTIIEDGTYSLFTVSLDFRFRAQQKPSVAKPPAGKGAAGEPADDPLAAPKYGPLGLSLKYVRGRDEPLFAMQHAITVGIALYR